MGAAFILASLTPNVAAAATGSATAGESGAAQRHALAFGMHVPGMHVPSAAERRALPAALRSVTALVSGPYFFVNRNSGKDMEVFHSETQNGALVDQYNYNGTRTQQWMLATQTSGAITQIINVNSNKCLDTSGSVANGTQLTIWQCETGNNNQSWVFYSVPGTTAKEIHPDLALRSCVEVYHSSTADYAKVDDYSCNGTATQNWYLYQP